MKRPNIIRERLYGDVGLATTPTPEAIAERISAALEAAGERTMGLLESLRELVEREAYEAARSLKTLQAALEKYNELTCALIEPEAMARMQDTLRTAVKQHAPGLASEEVNAGLRETQTLARELAAGCRDRIALWSLYSTDIATLVEQVSVGAWEAPSTMLRLQERANRLGILSQGWFDLRERWLSSQAERIISMLGEVEP